MSVRMLKYSISVQFATTVTTSPGAVIRHVGTQLPGEVCLWAEVPEATKVSVRRIFVVIGTGQEVHDGWTYVGTALDGSLVWHVYEVSS